MQAFSSANAKYMYVVVRNRIPALFDIDAFLS